MLEKRARGDRHEKTDSEGPDDVDGDAGVGGGVGGGCEWTVKAETDGTSAVRFRGRGKDAALRRI